MKNIKTFHAQSSLSVSELFNKLSQITTADFDTAKSSQKYHYYGEINDAKFNICNIKYGPHSSGPYVQGEVAVKPEGGTIMNFKIDIDEHKSYVNTIVALAILVVGISASLFTIMGQQDKFTIISLATVLMIFPLLYAVFIKMLLKSTQKEELKKILTITESKLTSS